MADILTIPKRLIQQGELVIVPRAEYEASLQIQKRLLWEERDTDEAIAIFEKERKARLLKKTSGFAKILGMAKARKQ